MTQLLLIPTAFERTLARSIEQYVCASGGQVRECGFGPIAAAATTTHWLHLLKPSRVILVGIAGSLSHLQIGDAFEFTQVACYGVGVGSGSSFMSSHEMGWKMLPELDSDLVMLSHSPEHSQLANCLVTCCAASADRAQAAWRMEKFPNAQAEDMEGFAVALACATLRIPLQIVRGISNLAGDRDPKNWEIEKAMSAACELAIQLLK